jgi:hypothetical protein
MLTNIEYKQIKKITGTPVYCDNAELYSCCNNAILMHIYCNNASIVCLLEQWTYVHLL